MPSKTKRERRFQRIKRSWPIVFTSGQTSIEGTLLNISQGGALIQIAEDFRSESRGHLVLPTQGATLLPVGARVLRRRPYPKKKSQIVALRFNVRDAITLGAIRLMQKPQYSSHSYLKNISRIRKPEKKKGNIVAKIALMLLILTPLLVLITKILSI